MAQFDPWKFLQRAANHIRQEMSAVRSCLGDFGKVVEVHSDLSEAHCILCDCMNEITYEMVANGPTGRGSAGWSERNGD